MASARENDLNPDIKIESLIRYISDKINTKKLLKYAKYVETNIKTK